MKENGRNNRKTERVFYDQQTGQTTMKVNGVKDALMDAVLSMWVSR